MGIEGQPGISRSSSNRTEPELVLDATIEGKDSRSHPFLHMNEKDVVWEMQVYGNWKNRGYQSHISDHSIKGRRYRREDRKRSCDEEVMLQVEERVLDEQHGNGSQGHRKLTLLMLPRCGLGKSWMNQGKEAKALW
ncbi:hypothetical protein AB3S75_036186 [Citrus x aurantiifolia]